MFPSCWSWIAGYRVSQSAIVQRGLSLQLWDTPGATPIGARFTCVRGILEPLTLYIYLPALRQRCRPLGCPRRQGFQAFARRPGSCFCFRYFSALPHPRRERFLFLSHDELRNRRYSDDLMIIWYAQSHQATGNPKSLWAVGGVVWFSKSSETRS